MNHASTSSNLNAVTSATALSLALGLLPLAPGAQAFQYNHRQITLNSQAQNMGRGGEGVRVAILDTPVQINHADLQPAPGRPMARYNRLHPYYNRVYHSHGTHVAGIIGGKGGTGIAPRATLDDVSVLSPYTGGWASSSLELRQAFRAAHSRGASIANMSWGMGDGYTLDHDDYVAISGARKALLAVKAAGNDGMILKSTTTPGRAQTNLENLILVGSVDTAYRLSGFSNRPGYSCFASYNNPGRRNRWSCREGDRYMYFFMVAPGEKIRSTHASGGYAQGSGTSFSVSHVVGAAALLQARWPHLKQRPASTANILFRTATDLGAKGVDPVYGWGLLNVHRAFSPLGQYFLYRSNEKRYPVETSRVGGTGTLYRMIGWDHRISSLSFFDEYERDFPIPSEVFDTSTPTTPGHALINALGSGTNPALDSIGGSFEFPLSPALRAGLSFQALEDGGFPDEDMSRYSADSMPDGFTTQRSGGQWTHWRVHLAGDLGDSMGWSTFLESSPGSAPASGEGLGAMRSPLFGAPSRLTQPVLSFAQGDNGGEHLGISLGNDILSLTAGYAQTAPEEFDDINYQASAPYLEIELGMRENLDLGINLTHLEETSGLLGGYGSGAFSLGSGFTTRAITLSTRWRPAPRWEVAAAYSLASTQQEGSSDILTLDEALLSEAVAIGISRTELWKRGDRINLALSQPLTPVSGSGHSTFASHLDADGELVTRRYEHDFSASDTRRLDLTLGYETPLTRESRLAVGAFASFDASETGSQSDAGGFVSVRWKF
ncbi:MAG: S8 family peptidase [Gammaproteobacteria bacterium]